MNKFSREQIAQELKRRGVLVEDSSSPQKERGNKFSREQIAQELRRRGIYLEPSFGQKATSLGKGLISGLGGGAIDTASLAYNVPAAIHNMQRETERQKEELSPEQRQRLQQIPSIPNPLEVASNVLFPGEASYIPSAQEGIEKGIDKLSGGYTKTPDSIKPLYEGVKFSGSLGGIGTLGKLAGKLGSKGLEKAAKVLGATKPSELAGAAATGTTIEATKDKLGDVGSLGAGLVAGIGTQFGGSLLKRGALKNIAVKQLSKKFRNEIYEAAKDINVPIPLAAVTDSKMVKFVNENISKYPYFGEKIHKAFQESSDAFQKSMENLLDSVGPSKSVEAKSNIKNLYKKAEEALPKNAVISSEKILNKIDEIRENFKSLAYDPESKGLLDFLEAIEKSTSIKSEYGRFSPPLPVSLVTNTKKNINRIAKGADEGIKAIFGDLNSALSETLQDYGKINPEWYGLLKKADKLFERYAKRKHVDKAFDGKLYNPVTEEVNYPSLIKTLMSGSKKETLQKTFGDNYENVEKFILAARGIQEGKRAVNPSGTASQAALYSFFGSVPYFLATNPYALIGHAATVGVVKKISDLLIDKEFIDLISKYSKDPTKTLEESINNFVKEKSGFSIQTLNHKINKIIHNNKDKDKDKDKNNSIEKINKFKERIKAK